MSIMSVFEIALSEQRDKLSQLVFSDDHLNTELPLVSVRNEEWALKYNDEDFESFYKRIKFVGPKSPVFYFQGKETRHQGCSFAMSVDSGVSTKLYDFHYCYVLDDGDQVKGSFSLNSYIKPKMDRLFYASDIILFKLTFQGSRDVPVHPLDLSTYIANGKEVALFGYDGKVYVSRRLLKMQSNAFGAMFGHDSDEKLTNEISMAHFNVKELKAFKEYLLTGVITDGDETALALMLLGYMYDIKKMSTEAKHYILKHVKKADKKKVSNILSSLRDSYMESKLQEITL